MYTNRIFTGNLMNGNNIIGTYVFFKNGEEYVFLDEIENIIDLYNIHKEIKKIRKFTTNTENKVYIDSKTLKPYYEKQTCKTLKKIKEDYLLDPRNPKGINI